MYTFATVDHESIPTLYATFRQAFSDYQVQFHLSMEDFHIMLRRRGFAKEISLGAYQCPGDGLVGLMLQGLRNWHGRLTAYDLMTGVTPPHRKHGITSRLFPLAIAAMRQLQVEQYTLEVLQENTPAFELYQKQGFSVTRNLACFSQSKSQPVPQAPEHPVEHVAPMTQREWEQLQTFWDFSPSWQNSIDSITAVPEAFAYVMAYMDGTVAGYGIIDKKTGDIPQIAVRPAHRRKRVAASILAALRKSTEADEVRILNVDAACTTMTLALQKLGFASTVRQYEMSLPLVPA